MPRPFKKAILHLKTVIVRIFFCLTVFYKSMQWMFNFQVCMNASVSWFKLGRVKMEIFMVGHQKRCRPASSLFTTGSPNVNFEKCWAIWFCYNETKAFFSRLSFLQRLFVCLTPRRGPFTLHSFGARPPTKRLQQKTTSMLWNIFIYCGSFC